MMPTMTARLMTWLTFSWIFTPSLSLSINSPLRVGRQTFNRHYVSQLSSSSEGAVKADVEDRIGAWIPIASASALTGLGPQRIKVMGLDLVVWEGDTWSVMSDACPHRMAPLSQGRVDPVTNCLECPYHGWQFDANGTLARLPQLDPDRTLESFKGGRAESLPVHKAGDLIYAFLPSSVHGEMFPQSLMPEDMYPTLREELARNCTYYTRELAYSVDFLIENFMDPAHIPFAHHSLQSVRSDGKDIPMTVLTSNFSHVECTFKDQSRGKERNGVVSWQRPSVFHFRAKNETDSTFRTNLNIHVIPVKAGRSRVIYSSPFGPIPTWLSHAAGNRFLNTDVWLHDAEIVARSRSSRSPYIYASQSDLGARAFRQWWSKHGFSTSPPNTFGPASPDDLTQMSRRELIDPWEYHSKQCSSCRRALKVMRKVQAGSLFAIVASVALLRNWPVRAMVVAVLGLCVNSMAAKTATVIEGNPYPSGISDRSPAHEEDYEQVKLGQRLWGKFSRGK